MGGHGSIRTRLALERRVVWSPSSTMDIGQHVFPVRKYELICETLRRGLGLNDRVFVQPQSCSESDLLLVHTPAYIQKLKTSTLAPEEIVQLEIPFTPDVFRSFCYVVGGTMRAARLALEHRAPVVHLGGGFHHAFTDHGEGFCLLNDVAISARDLLKNQLARKVLIIDLDLHQGNGTAAVFHDDPNVFTFSMHEEDNYPFFKPPSRLDIGLPEGTGDDAYLQELSRALDQIQRSFDADFIFYLAGSDPYRDDQLGRLRLSIDGLAKRDRTVFGFASRRNVPVCVTLAGGYARHLEDTVMIHVNTIKIFLGV